MGINGLDWQTVDIPLGIGLDQKGDARASGPPQLDILKDAQFDEIGGLQTRLPFGGLQYTIFDSANSLGNCRKLATAGDELLCFTKDSLYSWSPERDAWVFKATHLAAKVQETPRFVTTGDQTEPERAELDGTIVFAWIDAGKIYASAIDSVSGTVLVSPTDVGTAGHVRIVALQTRILLFTGGATPLGWKVRAIDPANPSAGLASVATTIIASAGVFFDATLVPGTDSAAFVCNGAVAADPYTVGRVTAGLVVTSTTKARACDLNVTLAVTPNASRIQVVRRPNAADVVGDVLDATTFADVIINQTIAPAAFLGPSSDPVQMTAAYSSTPISSGVYRCFVFFGAQVNTNAIGNELMLSQIDSNASTYFSWRDWHAGPVAFASKAFDHDGSVFVHIVFGGVSGFGAGSATAAQLQNTIYLYRADGHRVGKALVNQASGYLTPGYLPGVQSTGSSAYSFAATERRAVPLGTTFDGYADRGPRDVTVTFDSNEARRSVYLGRTLYITGQEIRQYDGTGLFEVGFSFFPYSFNAIAGIGGAMSAGTYAYKSTYRWQNAKGESERSTTATIGTIVTAASGAVGITDIGTLTVTSKIANPVAIEMWRTAVNPTDDAPYYLVTSNNPTALVPPNNYIPNVQTFSPSVVTFTDVMSDATVTTKETNPENGGFLECIPPPPATVIAASQDRIFLGNVAGDPDRVWYSRLRNNGEVASFHDALTFAVPQEGGAITAMAFLNETLIVFRERAIYAFGSDGYSNDGTGVNYGPPRTLANDVGAVNAESVAAIEQGLVFKSQKGWRIVNKGWQTDYIGAPVSDFDNETPLDIRVLTAKHQVRIVTAQRVLVWDYLVNQWAEWSISDAIDATIWRDTYLYLTAVGTRVEQTTFDLVDYGIDFETAWIKFPGSIQGDGRIRRILILGEWRSRHFLRVRIARNYEASGPEQWIYFDDQYWDPEAGGSLVIGANEQVRVGPSRQQCEAIKIRITLVRRISVESGDIYVPPDGEAIKLSGLALEIGTRRGPFRQLPSAQKL